VVNEVQLDLFKKDQYEHLLPYWWQKLKEWHRDIFQWRHRRDTTGWSMATGNYFFATALFRHGQINRKQFRRYWKFNRRVTRLDKLQSSPTP
jgi:hypothetical protein